MAGPDERRRQADKADEEWRVAIGERLDEHDRQLGAGKARMSELTTKIDENTEVTKRIEKGVADLLAIFNAFQGFVKVGGWVGKAVLYAASIVVACGILYWVWKTGDLPKKP